MRPRSADTRVVVIGAGFAGAATARALGRAGLGPGLILEQEPAFGVHASGRNAALLRLVEDDLVIRALSLRAFRTIDAFDREHAGLLDRTGALTLTRDAQRIEEIAAGLGKAGPAVTLLDARAARTRFPFLSALPGVAALFCPDEAVVDVHALLTRLLAEARETGFPLRTRRPVVTLLMEAGRVAGVVTDRGEIRAEVVVDAGGAWAGRLRPGRAALPLQPLRRHLFVSAPVEGVAGPMPYAWMLDGGFYFRAEGPGLLLSPCDETPAEPGVPQTDPGAAELLATKLEQHAPGLADLAIRRVWACLRTFAPDRRPVIGFDPDVPGLFHVAGLGGFGMTASAAVGELAAALIAGSRPDWIDVATVSPERLRER